ncbi:MAG: DUF2489 domain-containing protein [Gammaproteobacteria bacterium]|nr:DUF2489 domain-containing protein [Gammaproteobacteria bacterium]
MNITLIIIAVVIVAGLAVYAGKLLAQLKKQRQAQATILREQQLKISQRNEQLGESIRLIAKALVEQQCELSEGAIRICRLLERYHREEDCHFPEQYPNIHDLDQRLAAYPTHQAYKELKRQDRMRFDVNRAKWESELKQPICDECAELVNFGLS